MRKVFFLSIVLVTVFLFSCEKEPQEETNDVQSILDNVYADNAVENIFSTVNEYGIAFLSDNEPKIDTNIIVTITPQYPLDSFPKTMIINYGNGIVCNDNCHRKGKLIIIFDDKWSYTNFQSVVHAQISLNSFYINQVQVIGSYEITTNLNTDSVPEYTFSTSNSMLVYPNGESNSWEMTRNIKWIYGFETYENKNDDVFIFDGNTTGVNRKGIGYESEITIPMIYDNTCFSGTITKGKLELTPQGLTTRTVDFGNGSCDKNAEVTINDITFPITF